MKKIIVTVNQLPLLREENTATIQIPTDNNDASASLSKGKTQSDINNAQTTFGGNITAQFNPVGGPGDTTITIPNAKGGINGAAESIKDNQEEVGKALSNNMNVGVDVSENIFTKKNIEEARLKKMYDEGIVLTKKQLDESFLEEKYDVSTLRNKINNSRGDIAFKAYEAIGGSPNDFSGWGNISDIMINKYLSVSSEEQEKFRHILNGGSECDYEEPIDIEMDGDILQETKMNGGVSKSSNINTLCEFPQESNNEMKNLIKRGNKIYFKGENCWYMVPNANGEFNVYDDGEYEGHYCGSLKYLESLQSGSKALDYVISGL